MIADLSNNPQFYRNGRISQIKVHDTSECVQKSAQKLYYVRPKQVFQ